MHENATKLAPLATLCAALLPAIAVYEEFLWRLHPLAALAYFYLIALICYFAIRATALAEPLHITGGELADAEPLRDTARHLVLLAIFCAGFFGASKLLFGLSFGAWFKDLKLPLDQDLFWYAASLLLWLIAWRLAVRYGSGKLELNLAQRWKPVDVIFLLGLSALTWTALMIYMKYQKDSHQAMHVFGVQQGSVAPFVYIGLGLTFSVANALSEELWFRGLLLGALRGLMGMWPAILLQGLVFGLIHWFGTPQGVLGVVLAGVWGILLGWWTYTRRCLWQALLVHILADFAIWFTTNG